MFQLSKVFLTARRSLNQIPTFYSASRLEAHYNVGKRLFKSATPDLECDKRHLIDNWVKSRGFGAIEVGTVEAWQGREKRVIIISTVRANANLLDYDAKYQLGFLVDEKRFNVAITRAKAKCVIIGNPLCLGQDKKWQHYMTMCREYGTYHGFDAQTANNDLAQKDLAVSMTPVEAQGLKSK